MRGRLLWTGNTFLCNLHWQGENTSIRRRPLRQTSCRIGAVCLSLSPHGCSLISSHSLFPNSIDSFNLTPTQRLLFFKINITVSDVCLLLPLLPSDNKTVHFTQQCTVKTLSYFSKDRRAFLEVARNRFLTHLLSLQVINAQPCKWMSGGFLRGPGTTSQVKRRAETRDADLFCHADLLLLFYSSGCWQMPFCCQALIWWGDSPCSRVKMSRRSATLEDRSSSAWAKPHSCAPLSTLKQTHGRSFFPDVYGAWSYTLSLSSCHVWTKK